MILAATLKDAIVFICGYVLIFTVILAVITLIMVATPEAAAAIAKRGNTTYRCQVQQAGSGTCTWPTCGCGDA